jgi:hypothetical protein
MLYASNKAWAYAISSIEADVSNAIMPATWLTDRPYTPALAALPSPLFDFVNI